MVSWYQSHSRITFIDPLANFLTLLPNQNKVQPFSFLSFLLPHLSKKYIYILKSSLCSRPPLSRSGVYGHKITNQIPPFSRSDTTCSNAAKIDSIQRWTLCHELVEFSAVRSRAALSAPRASRAPYHTPCNFSPTCISDTRFDSQFAWLDPRPSIFYFQ